MDYMTAKDAAEKWNVSVRRVQILLKNGRIGGAVRHGKEYLIPKDALKPDDGRKNNHRQPKKEALPESSMDSAQSAKIVSSQRGRGYIFQIALCDDEKIFAETQEKLCRAILDGMNIKYDISVYENAEAFLADFSEAGKRYDLILLDIFMDGMDGLELAKKIREADEETAVIFLTSSPDYMSSGYYVRAFRYFQKCKDEEKLEQAIKEVYELRYKTLCLIIETGNITQRIPLKDIIALEINNKKVAITAKDEVFHYAGRLTELLAKLPGGSFVRCHKAFAVNVNNIYELGRSAAVAINGKRVPISRPYVNDVKTAFLNKFQVIGQ
ncbi:MAG: LytTR family transcriptional regulator DNA-binding domain-containing protein [Clostridiales bacterium]|jgi:excisionase family DNA binding protein|nr:LytTR family transcriptional regulator DNA-binding domain-containing protein [Clostridiales bacterium]